MKQLVFRCISLAEEAVEEAVEVDAGGSVKN